MVDFLYFSSLRAGGIVDPKDWLSKDSSGSHLTFWQLKRWHLASCLGMAMASIAGLFLFLGPGQTMKDYPHGPAALFVVAIFLAMLLFSLVLPVFWYREYKNYAAFNAEDRDPLLVDTVNTKVSFPTETESEVAAPTESSVVRR